MSVGAWSYFHPSHVLRPSLRMWQTADGILYFFKGVFYVYEWATQFVGLKVKELS